ncbi:MAG: hypothetical protein AB1578_00130 [Thermodesulfobacteriota bacterium]|jgi:hypothetical protein
MPWILAALLAAAAAALLPHAGWAASPEGGPAAVLVYSADERGEISPCG